MVKKILDVREMAPKERHPMIFNTFKGLEAGESFILVNDHEPKPLLYQFQAEHDGEFEWWTLEQGPKEWRVEITKREFKEPDRTITDFFQTDHRRLDAIVERFRDSADASRWEDASREFREFSRGLDLASESFARWRPCYLLSSLVGDCLDRGPHCGRHCNLPPLD